MLNLFGKFDIYKAFALKDTILLEPGYIQLQLVGEKLFSSLYF